MLYREAAAPYAMPITDNKSHNRFELVEDGHMALATYRRHAHCTEIPHVEADPALRGKGAASRLMQAIVELARKENFTISPTCPFARDWFAKHTEAHDVLAAP